MRAVTRTTLQAALAMASCLGSRQPAQHSLYKPMHGIACMLSSFHEQVTVTHSVQVVLLSATPYLYCLKCEVLARLATCSRYLNDTKTQRTAHEKGLLTCDAGQQTAERCVQPCCRAPCTGRICKKAAASQPKADAACLLGVLCLQD